MIVQFIFGCYFLFAYKTFVSEYCVSTLETTISLSLKIKNALIPCWPFTWFFLISLFVLFTSLFQNQPHYLLELLEVVFDLFRGVAHAHETVLSAIHRVIVRRSFCFTVYPFSNSVIDNWGLSCKKGIYSISKGPIFIFPGSS